MDLAEYLSRPDTIQDDTVKQMMFLYNAIQDGWTVTKKQQVYVFTKKHRGKKEYFSEEFLSTFVKKNASFKNFKCYFSGENSECG